MKRPSIELKRPNIRAVLTATMAALAIVSAVIVSTSVKSMTDVGTTNDVIIKTWLPAIAQSKEIVIAADNLREAYSANLLTDDKNEKQTLQPTGLGQTLLLAPSMQSHPLPRAMPPDCCLF